MMLIALAFFVEVRRSINFWSNGIRNGLLQNRVDLSIIFRRVTVHDCSCNSSVGLILDHKAVRVSRDPRSRNGKVANAPVMAGFRVMRGGRPRRYCGFAGWNFGFPDA